jgi:peptide/nickel transport system substrate-binding protein
MAFTYKERYSFAHTLQVLRNALWNYPYTLVRLYKGLRAFKAVFVIVVLSLILYVSYSYIYGAITKDRGLSGTLQIGIVNPSTTYNIFGTDNLSKTINKLVFNTLFSVNDENIPSPSLATSWTTNADVTSIVFSLRKGVNWQDGTTFAANDVIYSFELQKKVNPNGPLSNMSVKKIDTYTVEFDQAGVDNDIWEDLHFPILPDHTVYSTDEEIGTGPYLLQKTSGNVFSFTRNTNYFAGLPKIQNVSVTVYPNETELQQAFSDGDINFYELFDPNTTILQSLLNDHTDNTGEQSIISNYNALFFNTKSVTDANIRDGINYAINKNAISALLSGFDSVDNGPFNDLSWAYSTDSSIPRYPYSESTALASFKKSGYAWEGGKLSNSQGQQLQVTIAYDSATAEQSILNLIKQNLQSIGIAVTMQGYSQTQWTNNILVNKSFQIAYAQVQNSVDPDPSGLWISGAKANLSSYSNQLVDRTLDLAKNIVVQSQRQRAYDLFQKYLMGDSPAVFLYSPDVIYVGKPNVVPTGVSDDLAYESDIFSSVQGWYFK